MKSNYNVEAESYELGKEYTIGGCGKESIKATILANVKDSYDLAKIIEEVDINDKQSALTKVRDPKGNIYYALVKLGQGKGNKLFGDRSSGVLGGYFRDVCNDPMLKVSLTLEKSTIDSPQVGRSFKTSTISVDSYTKDKKLQEFVDYIISFSSVGSPYLISYKKDGEAYFILVSESNLDYSDYRTKKVG